MKTFLLPLLILFVGAISSHSQDFPFGNASANDLAMTVYDRDTSAAAVVLKEFGHAYISNDDYHLIFKHHVRIKTSRRNTLG